MNSSLDIVAKIRYTLTFNHKLVSTGLLRNEKACKHEKRIPSPALQAATFRRGDPLPCGMFLVSMMIIEQVRPDD